MIKTKTIKGRTITLISDDEPEAIKLEKQITVLKKKLSDTDYQAIKYAEGQISENDYAPIKAQRQAWRDEINRLEEELGKV